MSSHICLICNKKFRDSWVLKRHQQNSKTCSPVYQLNNKSQLIKNSNEDIRNLKGNISEKELINEEDTTESYNCIYCNKNYCHRQSLFKHQMKCKFNVKKEKEISIKKSKKSKKNKKYKKSKLKDEKKISEEKDILEEKNISEEKNIANITLRQDNCNNTINNTINNNTTLNITHHIHINPHGKEDLSFLSQKDKDDILSKKYKGIPELIKKLYQLPENRNFYKINQNKKIIAYIDNEGKIKHSKEDKIKNNILVDNLSRFEDFFESNSNRLKPYMQKQLQKVILESNEGKLNEKYMEDIELIMLDINQDNKKQIQTYLTSLQKNQKDTCLLIVPKNRDSNNV